MTTSDKKYRHRDIGGQALRPETLMIEGTWVVSQASARRRMRSFSVGDSR